MDKHDNKRESLIANHAALFFNRESDRTSLITVTGCRLSQGGKMADIIISVLPADKSESALAFAKRKRSDLREYLATNGRFRNPPRVEIVLENQL